MLTTASLLVLFAFGLLITGIVALGIHQAREDAKIHQQAKGIQLKLTTTRSKVA